MSSSIIRISNTSRSSITRLQPITMSIINLSSIKKIRKVVTRIIMNREKSIAPMKKIKA